MRLAKYSVKTVKKGWSRGGDGKPFCPQGKLAIFSLQAPELGKFNYNNYLFLDPLECYHVTKLLPSQTKIRVVWGKERKQK